MDSGDTLVELCIGNARPSILPTHFQNKSINSLSYNSVFSMGGTFDGVYETDTEIKIIKVLHNTPVKLVGLDVTATPRPNHFPYHSTHRHLELDR